MGHLKPRYRGLNANRLNRPEKSLHHDRHVVSKHATNVSDRRSFDYRRNGLLEFGGDIQILDEGGQIVNQSSSSFDGAWFLVARTIEARTSLRLASMRE